VAESLVAEKRTQYRTRTGIRIDLRLEENTYGAFASIDRGDFNRALSNIVDNAVEAIEMNGEVCIEVASVGGKRITVSVTDDGKGMPESVRQRIGEVGNTQGKKGGSGLGLHQAHGAMVRARGSLEVTSPAKGGTKVTLSLPRVEAPAWFATELALLPIENVIVVDDDPMVHEFWVQRLRQNPTLNGMNVRHCYNPGEVESEVSVRNNLYLIDYEFIDSQEDGLSIVRKLGIAAQSVLVTSHYEESDVQKAASDLGVRIIPKTMVSFVPLTAGEVRP
jgi:anti-sigma regulatory factor (Ser/Thr protein kinase)